MESSKQSPSSRSLPPWIGIQGNTVKLLMLANLCVEKIDYEKLAKIANFKKETCENAYRQAVEDLSHLWGLGGNAHVTELESIDLPPLQSEPATEDTLGSNEEVDSNDSAGPVEAPLLQQVAGHRDEKINSKRDKATQKPYKPGALQAPTLGNLIARSRATEKQLTTKDEAPKDSNKKPDQEMSVIKIDDSSSTAGDESDTSIVKSPVTAVKPKSESPKSSIKHERKADKSSKTTSSTRTGKKKLEKPAERKRSLKRRRQDTDSDGDSDTEGYLQKSSNIKGEKQKGDLKETKKQSPQNSRHSSMTPGQKGQLISVSSPPPDSFLEEANIKATKDDTSHEQEIDNGKNDSGSEQEIVGAAMDSLSLEVDFFSEHSEEDDERDSDYCDDPCDGGSIGFHKLKFHGEIAQDSDSEWA